MLWILFITLLVLLALGMDIFYAMGLSSVAYLAASQFTQMPLPLTLVPQQLMNGVDSFPLLAVPMFLLAGELMTHSGVTNRLVSLSFTIVGHIRGGLAQVAILVNAIMAGMTGSAVADLAATGSILIPAMIKRGYKPEFASAVIASASTMGPIIPPSITMVIVGTMVSVSVGRLFMGGVVPGLLMGIAMMIVTWRYAKRENLPTERRATLGEFLRSFRDSFLALLMPVFVIGAIVTGFATPSEASVIAVVYSLILGVVIYRQIKISELPGIFATSTRTSAAVMVTVAAAQLFGWITTAGNVGPAVGQWLTGLSSNPHIILLVINIMLLALGTLMETLPIILIAVPILFPIVTRLGVDPVHFGVTLTLNLMIGTLLPPMGLNILMVSALSNTPVMRVAREAVGFIAILILVLLLITYVPILVLWFPEFVYGTH